MLIGVRARMHACTRRIHLLGESDAHDDLIRPWKPASIFGSVAPANKTPALPAGATVEVAGEKQGTTATGAAAGAVTGSGGGS